MKLRFGIDAAARERIRARLDAMCTAPPEGRCSRDVYLDTPAGDLAAGGVGLRFRSRVKLGTLPGARGQTRTWRRQEVGSKAAGNSAARGLKALRIPRLKQRLDATFTVRTERWTWRLRGGWARVSLDRSRISTGEREDCFEELRITCKRKRKGDAMKLAVELGATHLASRRVRDRGAALLAGD